MDKPFASLSSSLLARKGQARPAMRPQGFAGYGSLGSAMDDLGWNDMGGEAASASAPASVVPVAPELTPDPAPAMPTVLRQRAVLRDEVEQPLAPPPVAPAPTPEAEVATVPEPAVAQMPLPASDPAPAAEASPPRAGRAAKRAASRPIEPALARGKAAFTLRLDPARHLRLRLATAVSGRSAQALVTEALDDFLAAIPALEGLAQQLPDASRGK